MATERFEAFCGGVSPAGLVTTIAPDAPAGGASVLGVTRDGATAWALAKPTLIEKATAAEAIADHLFESRRRALSLLRLNLLPRRCCQRSQIPSGQRNATAL
jgi:hypothetical protein